MELLDIYDISRIKTQKTMERGGLFSSGEYHMVVHVCIFNSRGEMLIQQRQPFKESWPNLWDITVGGCAVSGESSQAAAAREVMEEIGYQIDLNSVRPHFTINFDVGFDDYYLIEKDIEIAELILQYEEVKQAKWATKAEIIQMIDKGEFIPYYRSVIEMCFDMRKKYASHMR